MLETQGTILIPSSKRPMMMVRVLLRTKCRRWISTRRITARTNRLVTLDMEVVAGTAVAEEVMETAVAAVAAAMATITTTTMVEVTAEGMGTETMEAVTTTTTIMATMAAAVGVITAVAVVTVEMVVVVMVAMVATTMVEAVTATATVVPNSTLIVRWTSLTKLVTKMLWSVSVRI